MEEKYFIATLLFGTQPVFKKINALNADEAVEIIQEHYDNTRIIGLFSLDELDEIKQMLQENDNLFFVNELIFQSKEVKYKLHIEKNKTLEEVNTKYENTIFSILDSEDMVNMITHVYRWLSTDGSKSVSLKGNF